MRGGVLLAVIAVFLCMYACNKDAEIEKVIPLKPEIELDSEEGVYLVKIGKEVKIAPTYRNAEGAIYSWTCNGRIISTEPELHYLFGDEGTYYVNLRIDTKDASAEEDLRVEVQELAPPVISILMPMQGFYFLAGQKFLIKPDVQNKEGATYLWTMKGQELGTDSTYTFVQQEVGEYPLKLTVTNEDGKTDKEVLIKVVEKLPAALTIPFPSFFVTDSTRYVEYGRTLFLRAYLLSEAEEPKYQWSVNGKAIKGATSLRFDYKPENEGTSELALNMKYRTPGTRGAITRNVRATGDNEMTLKFRVVCCQAAPMRPYARGNKEKSNKVYEFVPAPGQFVNNTQKSGYNNESTHQDACAYAEKRLEKGYYVSLGGFGGYIVVGFDHSIENRGGYDFAVVGNMFDGSSEPGIVWVMQDVNGNGFPDDEWYELMGSEYGKPETIQDYAVTYFRPGPNSDTPWRDNKGNSGVVDRMGEYHPQPFYYPLWIKEDKYTLFGTCLKHRTTRDLSTGFWYNGGFDWGYADNMGEDHEGGANANAEPAPNRFKISNAVDMDGTPAMLKHIDFVKVQTGVNVKAGWLGENSTEVFGFKDLNTKKK